MLEIDESALIDFFGCAPEPQSQDEREFFAAPFFIKRVDGVELRFSVSAHFRDVRISLFRDECADGLLELVVPDVISVVVERDIQDQRLQITSATRGITEMTVNPTITIRTIA